MQLITNLLRPKIYFIGLLAVLLSLALAACGDSTVTSQPDSATATVTTVPTGTATTIVGTVAVTPTIATTPAVTTAAPTTVPATTTAATTNVPATTVVNTTAAPTTVKATTPATTTVAQFKPVLKASSLQVKIGGQVTLTGSGYPASTELEVNGGVQNPGLKYGKVKTDAQGKFTFPLNLNAVSYSYLPGPFTFEAGTPDRSLGAIVTITLLPSDKPVLKASKTQVKIGEQVVLTGSDYPANTELEVNGGVQNPALKYGKVKTDAQGKFSFTINLDIVSYLPGPFTFEAGTPDRALGAIVTVTLSAGDYFPTVKFTQDFFNALTRSDDSTAVKYLSAKLQAQVQNDQLTLGQLLGIARQPNAVEVSNLNGKQYNVQALMHFAGGDYILYLQVLNDANGQLKIIDFSKPFAA